MSQFEIRCHGRKADGTPTVHVTRTPALSVEDATQRARAKAIAAGVRRPIAFAVLRLS